MTTNSYEFRMDGRSADNARTAFGDLPIAEIQAGATRDVTVADEAQRLDHAHSRSSSALVAVPDDRRLDPGTQCGRTIPR